MMWGHIKPVQDVISGVTRKPATPSVIIATTLL
jgi:hypothetical protein